MKFYDKEQKKYFERQNEDKTRIPFPDKEIEAAFERAKNGERVDIEELDIDEFFDKSVIEKNLQNLELQYLLNNGGSEERIAELQAILFPVEEENEGE